MILNNQRVLDIAHIAFVKVDIIIVIVGKNRVSHIYSTTEPLDTIILVTVNLNIVDQCTVTNTLQSQTVNLVIWTSDQAAFSDTHITDNTAVVVGSSAAVLFNKVSAFTLYVTPGFAVGITNTSVALAILWCETLNDYTAPLASTIIASIKAAESNWACSRTVSNQLGTTSYQQNAVSKCVDIDTSADRQGYTLSNHCVVIFNRRDLNIAVTHFYNTF